MATSQSCNSSDSGRHRGRTVLLTREGWARFASIDELVRIEIKGSPLAGLIDDASYQKVLKVVRQELRDLRRTGKGRRAPGLLIPSAAKQ